MEIIINTEITNLIQDYRESQNAYTKEEKDFFRNKYGIESKKIKDISQAIIERANNLRKQRTEYDDNDWKIFNLTFDAPSSKKKLLEAFEGEHENFIKFALQKTYKPSWRGDRRYNIIKKILEEKQKSENNDLQLLIDVLEYQTIDFKERYIYSIVNHETKRFHYFEKYKTLKAWSQYNWKERKNEVIVSTENTCELPEKLDDRWLRSFNTLKVFSNNFDLEYFINKVTEEAEKTYHQNIEVVAEKLYKNKMINNITVKYISTDPKAFEMIITDGYKNAHCRSIFCAEYSHLVEAHWRFITTIKNK